MEPYLIAKWLHVLAACLYVGASFANGLLKTLADRAPNAEASAALLSGVVWNNRLLLVAPSVVLPVTGIWMARLGGLPLTSGWLVHGIALFALLSLLLAWGMRLEHRLAKLASTAAARHEPLPAAYHRLSPLYAALGLSATVALLAALFTMVTKLPLL